MNIQEFAAKYRLKLTLEFIDEGVYVYNALGKHGQIYEYGSGLFGTMFMPPKTKKAPWGKWTPRTWNNFKRQAAQEGMSVVQNGDSEGCVSFSPENPRQVALALRIAGVRTMRQLSPEHIERLKIYAAKGRAAKKAKTGG